ncbi:hypothetical protein [Nocardioides plantarum]|uniref:Lipoprotein n=1 Tax=Nocardioides plantarum TaxID=29299 RepID=A0ABV5K688_9ACTN|nr:hypothetical protein [Nocardioides plantarum]
MRPLRLILPLAVCAALLVGCGDDGDDDTKADPTNSPSQSATDTPSSETTSPAAPTTSSDPGDDPDGDADGDAGDDPSDDPSASDGPTTPVPADAAEVCGVFSTAYDAVVKGTGTLSTDQSTPLPAELVDALHAWGEGLADADLPSSLTDDESDGIGIMSRLLVAIPDDATGKDLATFDEKLSGSDDDKVEAASDWVDQTCNLDLS